MLPLATSTWDEKEYKAIQEVVASGKFTMGQHVAEFEKRFAQFVHTDYAVMVNSGSSANLLAVAALFYKSKQPLQPGDEVIVPAVSWATTYYPLQQYGLIIKFVDIDKDTLNLDLNQLAEAITDKTRLIFAVNLLGNPVEYLQLQKIIAGKNITVLEDNCESLGAIYADRQAGSFGIMGTFSTFFSHHISTMEGGVIVTNDEELYQILLCLRAHGWTRNLPIDNKLCIKSDNDFEESFRFILPGYNVRPLELSGAIGLFQLEKMPGIIEGRRANARVFQELFSNIPGVSIQKETGLSSWFGFALVVEQGTEKRDQLIQILQNNGVECRPIVAGNFVRNPVIKYFNYTVHQHLSNSELIHDCGFFFGNHHYDISNELERVAELVRTVLA